MSTADEALDKMAENAREIGIQMQLAQGCEYCSHALYAGTKCKNCGRVTEQAAIKRDLTPEQPAQQEPVAYIEHHKAGDNLVWDNPGANSSPLYTSPPAQRKPLTDEEQKDAARWRYMRQKHANWPAIVDRASDIDFYGGLDEAVDEAITAHGIKGEA